MLYFLLGFSISMNLFMLSLLIFLFKKQDFKSKIYEKVDETKEELQKSKDPFTF